MRKLFSLFIAACMALTMHAELPVFNVTEALAAYAVGTIHDSDSIALRGVVNKIEIKGKNFVRFGSACFYLSDATGNPGEMELFNCFSLNADTFKTTSPAYDPNNSNWAYFNSVADANNNDVWIGDTVLAVGQVLLFIPASGIQDAKLELLQGCYLTQITPGPRVEPAPDPDAPKNLGPKTIAEFLELKNPVDTCILTGVVTDIENMLYGNLYIADETDTLFIYGVLTPNGKKKQFETLDVLVGDTLTVGAVYTEYYGQPEAVDAVFIEVRRRMGDQTYNITMTTGQDDVEFQDATEDYGWWQLYAEGEEFILSLSNAGMVRTPLGTYTASQLDPDYSYVKFIETGLEMEFADGSITVAMENEFLTITGTLYDRRGNTYVINVTYTDPKAERTVNVICEGVLDEYFSSSIPGFTVEGVNADSVGMSLYIMADYIPNDYTIWDLNPNYSFVIVGSRYITIFDATVNVLEKGDGKYLVQADLLCYDNTLYKITMGIGYMPGTEGIDNQSAEGRSSRKFIQAGQLVIERNGIRYTATGQRVK